MVAPDLDIRWNEVGHLRVRASEHEVLGAGLKVVIDDLEGSRTVVAEDCLRVGTSGVYLGDVGIDD